MANTGLKGIDVRQTANELVFRVVLNTSAGALVTTGTTTIALIELQSDGTIKSYDFNDNTFKTTALTTATGNATYRKSNNAATDTGLYTYALATLTGFTVGAVYLVWANNANAFPTDQMREFQFGSAEGDFVLSGNFLEVDVEQWKTGTVPAVTTTGVPKVDLLAILGTTLTETAGQIAAAFKQWFNVATPTGTVNSLPNAAPNAAGGVLITAAGSLDMDDVGADVDAIETRVTLALPNAAANAAGGLLISTAGALDMDDLAADVDATETRVTLALPAAAAGAATGLLTLATAVRTTGATAETIEDALNAARAQGFGKWAIVGTTLSLYANDGSTVVRAFTLDSATVPTSRT